MIDLTPPAELKRKKAILVFGIFTKLLILLLVLVIVISAYYFLKHQETKKKLLVLDAEISRLNNEIINMSELEDTAKRISSRYVLLKNYLGARVKCGDVIRELVLRTPKGLSIERISFEGVGKRFVISGFSNNETLLSLFLNNLSKNRILFSGSEGVGDKANEPAFVDIRLDSLNVSEDGKVNYVVSFLINESIF